MHAHGLRQRGGEVVIDHLRQIGFRRSAEQTRAGDDRLRARLNQLLRAADAANAAANPAMVKRIAAEGHSIGHHTWSHQPLDRIGQTRALEEIDRGIAADEAALRGGDTRNLAMPFFRFPGFASTPALLDALHSRGIAVFGADLWASDWNPMTPEQQLQLLTARLDDAGKGIILLHDPKAQTARMLPAFLQYLKRNGYKVVHLVASQTARNSSHDR